MQERVGSFLAGLAGRKEEVKHRCRTVLLSRADTLLRDSHTDSQHPKCTSHLDFGLVEEGVGSVFDGLASRKE